MHDRAAQHGDEPAGMKSLELRQQQSDRNGPDQNLKDADECKKSEPISFGSL